METNKRKEISMNPKRRRKSFFVDIRFLVVLFTCVFFALGGLTIAATSASNSVISNDNANASDDTVATDSKESNFVFYFKRSILELDVDSASVSDFLIISDQTAVTSYQVVGECVSVSLNPFTITVVKEGEAIITLVATMIDGETKTISVTVVVTNTTIDKANNLVTDISDDENEEQEENTYDLNNNDSLGTKIDYKLLYDNCGFGEFSFFLLIDGDKTFDFCLVVMQSENVDAIIIGSVVWIIHAGDSEIAFAAVIDGKVVAEVTL